MIEDGKTISTYNATFKRSSCSEHGNLDTRMYVYFQPSMTKENIQFLVKVKHVNRQRKHKPHFLWQNDCILERTK